MTHAQGKRPVNRNYPWGGSDIGLNIQSWYNYVQRAKGNHVSRIKETVGIMSQQTDINQDRNY